MKEFLSTSGDSIYVSVFHFRFTYRVTFHLPKQIYDGYDETAPVDTIDAVTTDPIVSSSNVVFMASSRDFFSETLLKIEWNEVSQKRVQIKNETETLNCTENSIVYVNNETNTNISSPGYPYGYDTNLNCTWILKPDQIGYHAMFLFLEIDLEDTVNCLSDYVKVSSSNDLSNYNVLNKTCQRLPAMTLPIHGNPYLQVNFITDYYSNRTGFVAIAKAVCGAPMTASSGVITVTKELQCEW